MASSYWIGAFGVALLALVWLGIQRAWQRTFPEVGSDPDVLAARSACGACLCTHPCERRGGEAAAREDPT